MNCRLHLLASALALVAFAVTAKAQTTFSLSSTAANYTTGATVYQSDSGLGGLFSTGTSFDHSGPTSGGITGETFGQSFHALANGTGTQAGTAAWLFDGVIGGADIAAGTVIPISYGFSIAKNPGITSAVSWSLHFDGDRHGGIADVELANGTLNYVFGNASATFLGTVDYTVPGAVSSGSNFRAYLEVSFTTNVASSPGEVTVTMLDTGFGGQGITVGASAVPEPSTYALAAGMVALGCGIWNRRRREIRVRAAT
jgi:hypothetical protein